MTPFEAAFTEWDPFFSAAAGIAATLVGLLFVALALNPAIMVDDSPAGLRVWSGQTFHSFLMVLTLSLFAVIPDETGVTLAIALVITGVTGLIGVGRALATARRDPDPNWRLTRAVWRFFSPLLAYAICLWAAYLAWRQDAEALGWMVAVIFLLMMSATSSCWDLLKALGNPNRATPTE